MGPDREDPSQPTECDASTGNGMSMADDNTLRRYRSNDPYRRAAEPLRPSEEASARDPLAELARLLGQSDPFADLGRSNSRERQGEAHDAPATWEALAVARTSAPLSSVACPSPPPWTTTPAHTPRPPSSSGNPTPAR